MLPTLACAGFASMSSIRLADPMLPALAAEFGGEPADMSAVITAFALAYGVMQLVWGPLGDRMGKLRVITWAALAATLGSLACALAPSLPLLSAARLVTGASCAAIIPLAIAFVGDTVAYEARQATLAQLATGTLTGMIAGQVIGGTMADTLGWRAAFYLMAALFLFAGIASVRLRRRLEAAGPRAVPIPAPLLAGWGVVLVNPWARTVLAVAMLEGALMFGALAFVPSWLHERTGMSLSAAGAAVAAFGAGGLAFATTAKRWIPILGERGQLSVGGVLTATGFVALALAAHVPAGTSAWAAALLACAVTGLGFYMLHNMMQTLATQLAPKARATALGLFAVSLFLGQALGVAVTARIGPAIGLEPVIVGAGLALAAVGLAMGRAAGRRRVAG